MYQFRLVYFGSSKVNFFEKTSTKSEYLARIMTFLVIKKAI